MPYNKLEALERKNLMRRIANSTIFGFSLLAGSASLSPLQADVFGFSYNNEIGTKASGLLTTDPLFDGRAQITGISGQYNGTPITTLAAPGTCCDVYKNNNTLYYPAVPFDSFGDIAYRNLDNRGVAFKVGGKVVDLYVIDWQTEEQDSTGELDISGGPLNITPIKTSAQIAEHTRKAEEAEQTLKQITAFSGIFTAATLVGAGTLEKTFAIVEQGFDLIESTWAKALAVGVGFVVAPVVATILEGEVTATAAGEIVISTTLSLLEAYFEAQQKIEQKLANDPPDSDYMKIYQSTPGNFSVDLGLGGATNDEFDSGIGLLGAVLDDEQGLLTSMERYEGAILAGDLDWADRQKLAMDQFDISYKLDAQKAADWFSGLPSFINPIVAGTNLPDLHDFDNTIENASRDLRPNNSVPEPSTAFLFFSGLIAVFGVLRGSAKSESLPA